jgi:cytoskeletal protein CcmA (bactofilin family)
MHSEWCIIFYELPTGHADFREIKGSDDALGGRRILRQIVIGSRAPSASLEGTPRLSGDCIALPGQVEFPANKYQCRESDMVFTNVKGGKSHSDRVVASAQQEIRGLVGDGNALQPEAASSISSGLSIIGKIIGQGALTIFGRVEGEVRASTVLIAEGAEMLGDVVAEELTVGGQIKGTIHANRVKLDSTGVVEGDIFHRTLAIEENARFEGMSRRNDNPIDAASRVQTDRPQTQTVSSDGNGERAAEAVGPPPNRTGQPVSSEQRIGIVTNYYGHLSVVAMQLDPGAMLRVGDVIHIHGRTTDFTQQVESLEVNRAPVSEVGPNDDFGLKVIEHAREHDAVFKVTFLSMGEQHFDRGENT